MRPLACFSLSLALALLASSPAAAEVFGLPVAGAPERMEAHFPRGGVDSTDGPALPHDREGILIPLGDPVVAPKEALLIGGLALDGLCADAAAPVPRATFRVRSAEGELALRVTGYRCGALGPAPEGVRVRGGIEVALIEEHRSGGSARIARTGSLEVIEVDDPENQRIRVLITGKLGRSLARFELPSLPDIRLSLP